jgi:tellurium resistance protein TerD
MSETTTPTLEKGQRIDLTKTNPGLEKIMVGLGWDPQKNDPNEKFDLDSFIIVKGNGSVIGGKNGVVFF